LVLVEFIAFFCLGKTLGSGKDAFTRWAFLCGLCVGVGFYTYFSWILVALLVSAALGSSLVARKKIWPTAGWFLAGGILPLLPLVWIAATQGYGHYLGVLWPYKAGFDWVKQLQVTATCLSAFLWGSEKGYFSYGPVWGGFLNPILGALFLIGMIQLRHRWKESGARAVLLGILLFMAPVILSRTLTNMREIQVLPLMLLTCSFGALTLLRSSPTPGSRRILLAFLVLVPMIDTLHLGKFSDFIGDYWGSQKTQESRKAYSILEKTRASKGPGLILTSFSNDTYTYDQSILTATYHFNALRNPRLRPQEATWLSVVTNVHFEPFLAREFPDAEWTHLASNDPQGRKDPSGGLLLAVIPFQGKNVEKLAPWVEADTWFWEMSASVMDLPIEKARHEILRILEGMLPSLPKDRFIRSIYWEMVFFNHNWENLYGNKDFGRNFPRALAALENAVTEGYPTAYFWNELGTMQALKGEPKKAEAAFRKAMAAPLDLTPARENLKSLQTHKP
jgi:hypothetical protein